MSTIIITEKPSVAQEYRKVLKVSPSGKTNGYVEGYSSVLGTNVVITWAVGHLIAICSPDKQNEEWSSWKKENLPMIPKQFKYEPQKSTFDQFKVVKSIYTRPDIDCIYYAGDSGREGIYIQALIRNQIFKSKPKFDEKVVWIDSFTEEAILNGIKTAKPYATYQPMIDSGYARAIADWLIGMNLTEAFTLTSGGYKNTIRVGRVMTPTLAMIVNRQKEIDNFVRTPYFGVKADDFASWKSVEGSPLFESDLLYNESGFKKREDAEKLIADLSKSMKLTVSNVKVQPKTEYAPYLFNLADLQAYCSKSFHISPADTLAIAQRLYEGKYTTYPRTDCRFLSTAVQKDLKAKGYSIPDRYVDDSKITDHYAIIPTLEGNANSLSGLDKQVYDVIMKRFSDTMKPPYVYDAVSVDYVHNNKEHFFEAFRIVKQAGYKGDTAKEDAEAKDKAVPEKGAVVSVSAFNMCEMETRPPSAYTTGSLILAMEKAGKLIEDEELRETIKTCGIGTSATRANIIEKLKDCEFITIDKKQKIAPTDKGNRIIPIIAKYDEALVSPIKTADMEGKLNHIAQGELTADEYRQELDQYVRDAVSNILKNNAERLAGAGKGSTKAHNCPCCGKELKYGRYGWYCDCKYGLNLEICGHKMTENDLEDLINKGRTKVYSFKSKAGKSFKASLVLNKNEHKNEFEFQK